MSNSVDILLIDGPSSGTFVCQPRPVPATTMVYSSAGDHVYTHRTHRHKANQLWYHLMLGNPDYPWQGYELDAIIDYYGHQPAWDLNPMAGQVSGEV